MRFLEGLSTGAMLGSYILKQRSLLDHLLNNIIVHWFFSFWFHMTYLQQIYIMDTLLIHMMIIERALKCFPEIGVYFQVLFLVRNEKIHIINPNFFIFKLVKFSKSCLNIILYL